jgi:hypothetical protein
VDKGNFIFHINKKQIFIEGLILVATHSKAWVCGRSLAGILGSNHTNSMNFCLL